MLMVVPRFLFLCSGTTKEAKQKDSSLGGTPFVWSPKYFFCVWKKRGGPHVTNPLSQKEKKEFSKSQNSVLDKVLPATVFFVKESKKAKSICALDSRRRRASSFLFSFCSLCVPLLFFANNSCYFLRKEGCGLFFFKKKLSKGTQRAAVHFASDSMTRSRKVFDFFIFFINF